METQLAAEENPKNNAEVDVRCEASTKDTLNVKFQDGSNLHNITIEERHSYHENIAIDSEAEHNIVADDDTCTRKILHVKIPEETNTFTKVNSSAPILLTPQHFMNTPGSPKAQNKFLHNTPNSSSGEIDSQRVSTQHQSQDELVTDGCNLSANNCSRILAHQATTAKGSDLRESFESFGDGIEMDHVSKTHQHPLERVQMPEVVLDWKLLKNCYTESHGYRLGVKDCPHYEGDGGIMVEVPNGKNFEVVLGKTISSLCNVDITVNGIMVAKLQMRKVFVFKITNCCAFSSCLD